MAIKNKKAERLTNWQALIDALPYPVAIYDQKSGLKIANKPFTTLGDAAGDLINCTCFVSGRETKKHRENCLLFLKHSVSKQTGVYLPNLRKYFLVNTSPLQLENSSAGIILSITDITELKVMINELSQREKSLQRSRDAFLNMLEDINDSYKDLQTLFMSLIKAMVNALDAKSPWTKGHSERVSLYAEKTAIELGQEPNVVKNCSLAGLLHDIGKIGTYDTLLDKPEHLTGDEMQVVMKHPVLGEEILSGVSHLKEVIPLIRHHHERVDGLGYPDGLKSSEIPLSAKILHVADSFDSMTSDRPYRNTPGLDYALSELKKNSGKQFDPKVTRAFFRVLKDMGRI